MKLDRKDYHILWELDNNARIAMSTLAERVHLSKQNLNYRVQRLKKEEILLKFVSIINSHKLGYPSYRVYFRFKNTDEKKEQQIIKYFQKHQHIIWFVSLAGSWDYEVVFIARNFVHFNNMLKDIRNDFKNNILKYNISMSVVNYHLPRDYLINKKRKEFSPKFYGFEPSEESLDEVDIKILIELSKDCRQTNFEIGEKASVTYNTVKQRIKKLEEKQIIQGHRALINFNKLDLQYYKLTILLNNPSKEEEKELYAFCGKFQFITYLVEVVGEWQFEIEAEVKEEKQIVDLIREIKNKFPNVILDYNILKVIQEHKLNYFPIGKNLLSYS